ncbi:MAG: thioredoxin domain-containing protein, partial [Acidobacteria bacterium]|nr:thioredoxin domain-containing protein [Acidobacteriota bacterium]
MRRLAIIACALILLLLVGVDESSGTGTRAREAPPGAEPAGAELAARLAAAFAAQPSGYEPRTHHLRPDGGPRFVNRLIMESSPYLLQHAHNPVNWYPWGEEAFAAARRLDRLVLLSIGYSTCHWCHVMERESFEDLEIAGFLNQHFVAIKVDREERPDLDAVYMSAVQLITGRGGWPMTLWLTPDAKPIYGGTYFPARDGDRGASVGFLTMLGRVKTAYAENRSDLVAAGDRLTEAVRRSMEAPGDAATALPSTDIIDQTARLFHQRFDATHGGTAGAPKFPSNMPLRLLMRHYHRTGDSTSLTVVERTLEKMAAGGIYDQVGGGFHRYSTDVRWLVPHFEKMLYDNALLALAYVEAFQITGRADFASTLRGILDYVAREMSSPEGGFYSATDADSPTPAGHDEEGLFFTWTPEEITAVVGPESARVVERYFAVKAKGNFEGRSILHRPEPVAAVADELGLSVAEVLAVVDSALPLLYAERLKREPPILDDKILTAWNGLMISAFAVAGRTLDDSSYLARAEQAGEFIWHRLRNDGRLMRAYRAGQARNPPVLEDYAFLIASYIDLYEATFRPTWLKRARQLQTTLDARYPAPQGGYYRTADDASELLARELPARDGARPSGNTVAALNLLRLAELTGEDAYRASADRLILALTQRLQAAPAGLTELQLALDFRLATVQEVVIVAPDYQAAAPFLARLRGRFAP